MKKANIKKVLSCILCAVLIAATALLATSCKSNAPAKNTVPAATVETTAAGTVEDPIVLGSGSTKFTFTSTDVDGKDTVFAISTSKETVGDALVELGVISGDNGQYGLYVKTVNGVTLDFDKDGKYWAFYVDGEYASAGVDMTKAENGKTYAFKAE